MTKELRIKGTELRTVEGDALKIEGYVNAVGRESELLFSPKRKKWFKEIMEPGVFKRALENNVDIPMLLEHDYSKEIARTSNGTLELTEDNIGLKFKATITDQGLYDSIHNGEINSCSFGFICEDADYEFVNNKEEKRYVKDLQLLEVSLVKNPAYIGSLVEARNMEMALEEFDIGRKENTMDKNTNQEKRAYCSYLWDTQDVVNCCLELMACATSLLTYKECKNVEIQNLSKDILSKVSSYMVELTSDTNEQRSIEEVVETEEKQETEVVETIEDRAKDEESDEKSKEKEESDKEPKKSEEKTDEKDEESEEKTDKKEESDKKTNEKEESDKKTDEKDEESDEKRGLSPEDELLLLRARLSNLK